MTAEDFPVVRPFLGYQFQRSKSWPSIWNTIVDPYWMLYCKRLYRLSDPRSVQCREAWTIKVRAMYMIVGWLAQHVHFGVEHQPLRKIDFVLSHHNCDGIPQQRKYHYHHDNVWLRRHIDPTAIVWNVPYSWPFLLAPRENWFSTQIKPDAASLYMVPPSKRRACDSHPYPVGKHPGVLQMNWSVETKSPTSYWSLVLAPSRSSSGWVRETLGERFFARANRHDLQGGTIQFLVEGFFGWIIAGRIVVLPSGSS